MSTSSSAHLFAIFLKLLLGRVCFIVKASISLNLAGYFSFSDAIKPEKSPSMYDPYHPVKPHFSQKILCYHLYQLPEAATGDVL